MAIFRFDRAGRVCGAVLLVAAALAGCGESGSDTAAGPAGTPSPTIPAVSTTPSPSPASTAASRPNPAQTSRSTPAAPSDANRVPLGKDFRVKEGKSAAIAGTDLVVTFARLVTDSRCPTDVTCIRQGEATIALTVTGVDGEQSFQLSAPPDGGPDDKQVGGFLIHLEAVEPWPADPADAEARPGGPFVAVLRVSRA